MHPVNDKFAKIVNVLDFITANRMDVGTSEKSFYLFSEESGVDVIFSQSFILLLKSFVLFCFSKKASVDSFRVAGVCQIKIQRKRGASRACKKRCEQKSNTQK